MTELCKLGCGKEINFEEIIFSDKVTIRIPKDGDQLHVCKNVQHYSIGNTNGSTAYSWIEPEPDDDTENWKLKNDGFDFKIAVFEGTIIDNFFSDDHMRNYEIESFANRQLMKKVIGSMLYEIPYFFSFPLSQMFVDAEFFDHQSYSAPLALLGGLYEMDGKYDDARKCYEIMNELPKGTWDYFGVKLSRISELEFDENEMFQPQGGMTYGEFFDLESYRLYVQNVLGDKIDVADTKTIFPDTRDNKHIKDKIADFEKNVVREFLRKNFSGTEIEDYLKNRKWRPNGEDNLSDKSRYMRKKSSEGLVENIGPDDDFDYLDLKDCVKMIIHFFWEDHKYHNEDFDKDEIPQKYRDLGGLLYQISDFRNIISHDKNYNPKQFEARKNSIIAIIDEVTIHLEEYRRD